jgi:hypothetical protein
MLQILSNLKRYSFALIAALAFWIAIIVSSGAGFNPTGVDWNFSNTGTFGDSFGPISALMASLAALAAFSALHEQKQETTNAELREAKREKQDAIRAFENTFFNLVGFFEKTVAQTDIDRGMSQNMKSGRDAFSYIYTMQLNIRLNLIIETISMHTMNISKNILMILRTILDYFII